MGRFLFVVPPFFGHVNPTVSVAAELMKMGHEVSWVGHKSILTHVVAQHKPLFLLDENAIYQHFASFKGAKDKESGLVPRVTFGIPGFKFLMEQVFVPIARDMLEGTGEAIRAFAPDVVITDQQCFAGAIAAQKAKLPWASLCTTSASVVFSFSQMPKVNAWITGLIEKLQDEAGIPPGERFATTPFPASQELVVLFSTKEFAAPDTTLPAHYRYVGPSLQSRVETAPFPFEQLKEGVPRLLVSFGTLNAGESGRIYEEVFKAFEHRKIQVIMVAPDQMLQRVAAERPDNFIVSPFIPQLAVLGKVNAVMCHGGHNTVIESLVRGLPLVIAPITDDQPVIADQVVKSGSGLRINFRRAGADAIYTAVNRVLTEPGFAAGARRMQSSLEHAGGAPLAAQLISGLLKGISQTQVSRAT